MLKLENVSFKAIENGEKVILKNINFEFEKGKTYCITGPNGCGKSTLAKIIMGVLPLSCGKILWQGKDITKLSIHERAKLGIGFAFQNPVHFKGLTARDLLSFSSQTKLTTPQACECLSVVGLCAREYLDRELDSTLSGGELKRIEIASVLARNAEFSIFDEPEAGIDIWSFSSLVTIFKRLKEQARTSVIISHQEKLLENADEIILMEQGNIKLAGPSKEVLPKLISLGSCSKLREDSWKILKKNY